MLCACIDDNDADTHANTHSHTHTHRERERERDVHPRERLAVRAVPHEEHFPPDIVFADVKDFTEEIDAFQPRFEKRDGSSVLIRGIR